MIDDLVIHPHTKEHVAQFINQPVHAVMLVGANGIGKTCIAKTMVAAVLHLPDAKVDHHPYFKIVSPEKDSISIEAIRELQRFLQLKTLGEQMYRRAVIIEHAECLTVEAQNAYLKLLEEPPADTLMILTVDNSRALLPTVLSRAQSIPVYGPTEEALRAYFVAAGKDEAAINQAFFLSGGLPGLMSALLTGDETHPLLSGVANAKAVLQKQTFERLAMVEGLSKQKESARFMLEALQHIAQTGLDQAATKDDMSKIKQWHHMLTVSSEALEALQNNANTKLVLSNLMLHI
jgi:DNA polymerase III subunit delta'